jgi:hypothetical protein
MVAAFGSLESERRWVDLAKSGLASLGPATTRPRVPSDHKSLNTALSNARKLSADGKVNEAAAAFRALEELYRDDPVLLDMIRSSRAEK